MFNDKRFCEDCGHELPGRYYVYKYCSDCYVRLTNEKNKAAQDLGKRGGQKTASLYGKEHFSQAGKKGMAKRWGKKPRKSQG